MTDFNTALLALCDEKKITRIQAFERATPNLVAEKMVAELDTGNIPDLSTIKSLCDYFNTGIDTFLPGYTFKKHAARTYLCGSITNTPDYMTRFTRAKALMEANDRHVFSPAHVETGLPTSVMIRREFMNLGIFLLSMCDEIAVLPGYETHSGCRMELAYANANNMQIIKLTKGHLEDGRRILESKN